MDAREGGRKSGIEGPAFRSAPCGLRMIQKIEHGGFRHHGRGGAVLLGTQALLATARARLQIGAEMARPGFMSRRRAIA
jgi:hypothetical protein